MASGTIASKIPEEFVDRGVNYLTSMPMIMVVNGSGSLYLKGVYLLFKNAKGIKNLIIKIKDMEMIHELTQSFGIKSGISNLIAGTKTMLPRAIRPFQRAIKYTDQPLDRSIVEDYYGIVPDSYIPPVRNINTHPGRPTPTRNYSNKSNPAPDNDFKQNLTNKTHFKSEHDRIDGGNGRMDGINNRRDEIHKRDIRNVTNISIDRKGETSSTTPNTHKELENNLHKSQIQTMIDENDDGSIIECSENDMLELLDSFDGEQLEMDRKEFIDFMEFQSNDSSVTEYPELVELLEKSLSSDQWAQLSLNFGEPEDDTENTDLPEEASDDSQQDQEFVAPALGSLEEQVNE
eukprot:TRINITY_DN3691_c2_g1_i1.p1 TRINITY_DN3691_c2_g1~~TRINITY_DN3691_c2_g1_i1.p1  ORF type:complete len:385 (-),score=73.99 TRINITY_DN3691_c2_g1_i1:53-1093(-)